MATSDGPVCAGYALDAEGHLVPGLVARSKRELAATLNRWLRESSAATIGDVGTYGGRAHLHLAIDGYEAALNADTKRGAINEHVRLVAREGPDADWRVVANDRGVVNKVVPTISVDRLHGWYCYLTTPLSSPETISTSVTAAVVQFPHPGGEHSPPPHGDEMPWNTGDHRRKFLRSHGRYIDDAGAEGEAELVFWGEWEAPSRVVERWASDGRKPRALHEPYWCAPPTGERQNTDPWVFGPAFRYSNCKQQTVNGPTNIQRLPRGSLIIFGSTLDGEFVVDTVFVVASARPWTPSDSAALDVDDAFRTCTIDSVATTEHRDAGFTVYSGATPKQPVEGMYSFVPARRADDPAARFARPALHLPDLVNPASTMAPKGVGTQLSSDDVRDAWLRVREQVSSAGCVLGVNLHTPHWQAG